MSSIVQESPLPAQPRPIVSIGAGGVVSDAHLPAYRIAGFPVASIFDLRPERATALAGGFGIPLVCTSLAEAIHRAPAHAVFDVAVPAAALLPTLRELPRGASVLIQKPMGETFAEAGQILELCRERQLNAAVNFQLRYAPNIIAARDLIGRGLLGEIHDMEVRVTVYTPWHLWTFLEGIPRVEILYHSVHYVDLIRSFLGEPRGVHARTVKHPKTARLASTRSAMILDYGDTQMATVTTNHGHDFGLAHQESYVKWEGTRGAIKVRLGLLMNYPKGEPDAFDYCLYEGGGDPQWQSLPLAGSWYPHAFIGTMADLMRVANGEIGRHPTAVEDAIRTMAVVEAAYASSATGGVPPARFSEGQES